MSVTIWVSLLNFSFVTTHNDLWTTHNMSEMTGMIKNLGGSFTWCRSSAPFSTFRENQMTLRQAFNWAWHIQIYFGEILKVYSEKKFKRNAFKNSFHMSAVSSTRMNGFCNMWMEIEGACGLFWLFFRAVARGWWGLSNSHMWFLFFALPNRISFVCCFLLYGSFYDGTFSDFIKLLRRISGNAFMGECRGFPQQQVTLKVFFIGLTQTL